MLRMDNINWWGQKDEILSRKSSDEKEGKQLLKLFALVKKSQTYKRLQKTIWDRSENSSEISVKMVEFDSLKKSGRLIQIVNIWRHSR